MNSGGIYVHTQAIAWLNVTPKNTVISKEHTQMQQSLTLSQAGSTRGNLGAVALTMIDLPMFNNQWKNLTCIIKVRSQEFDSKALFRSVWIHNKLQNDTNGKHLQHMFIEQNNTCVPISRYSMLTQPTKRWWTCGRPKMPSMWQKRAFLDTANIHWHVFNCFLLIMVN